MCEVYCGSEIPAGVCWGERVSPKSLEGTTGEHELHRKMQFMKLRKAPKASIRQGNVNVKHFDVRSLS
jgi:hypothetical protein